MGNISLEQELLVTFIGALSYGLYLSTLAHCLRWQLFADDGRTAKPTRNWYLITITISIFGLVTAYISISLFGDTQTVHGTINHLPPSTLEGNSWTMETICVVGNLTALLADIVLMYRCWIVYGRRKIILIFPVFMWIGGVICTVLQAYQQFVLVPTNQNWKVVNMSVGPGTILTPFWATTLALNIYTMSMLMYRIWSVRKKSPGLTSVQTLKFTMRILADSGFLYLSTTIAHFLSRFTPNNLAVRITEEMNIVAIGIAFNLILIRVGQNRARENSSNEMGSDISEVSDMRYSNNSAISVHRKPVESDLSQETSKAVSRSVDV